MSNPHCRPATPSDEEEDLYSEILRLEERTWRALSNSGPSLLPFLSLDCTMQFPLGIKVTARSTPTVRDLLHSPAFVPWSTFRLRDVDVAEVGPRGAVVSYRVEATRKGKLAPSAGRSGEGKDEEENVELVDDGEEEQQQFDALCVSVWRWEWEGRRDQKDKNEQRRGKWLMCFHQQTLRG